MEDILIFQHDPLEDLGIFAQILEKRRLSFRYVRLFQEETPTEEWKDIRALLLMGGAMGVYEEERYPFLRWEKAVIRSAMKEGIPILGVCLGAQLIAAAAGATVYPGNFKEIGWYPISMTVKGQVDALLGYLPAKPTVFQWHGDGFDLPPEAQRLASSLYYDNQAFRLGKTVYGLQFHLEVTPVMIEQWMDCHWKELAQTPYTSPDKIRADTRSYAQELKYFGERFFSEFVRRVLITKQRRGEGQAAKA